jgi:hypothetical protein
MPEDVGTERQRRAMDVPNSRQRKVLAGIELRYVVTMNLAVHGPATVVEIIELLEYQGFVIAGRASKTVSDALRWEMRRGRVRRIRRGKYGAGQMPRSTEHYIHKRAIALREEADRRIGRDDDAFWDSMLA